MDHSVPEHRTDHPRTEVRVLMCGRSEIVRRGISGILLDTGQNMRVVGETNSLHSAVPAIGALDATVVLVDATFEDVDTIATMVSAVLIRYGGRAAVVVVLSEELDRHGLLQLLCAGASGLILRDGPGGEVIYAIRAAADGDAFVSPPIARWLVDRLRRQCESAHYVSAADLQLLTPREREVFGLLGRGLSNAEMAGCLNIREKTVKYHVSNVLAKLHLRRRGEAIVLARTAEVTDELEGPSRTESG